MKTDIEIRHEPPLIPLKPIARQSVNEAVYQALRNKLMHGEYRAGKTLGIQELAGALQTSTMPVREALRRLVAQNALEPMPNGTTRVPLITAENLADIRRVRLLNEGTAIEWAAPHMQTSQLNELEALAHQITQERRTPDGVVTSLELNRVFHFSIYRAAQSTSLLAIIESLWLQSGPYLRATRELLHADNQPADHLHEKTIAALRAGEVRAARSFLEADISWVFDRVGSSVHTIPTLPTPSPTPFP